MMDMGGGAGLRGPQAICDSGRAKDPIGETNETERTKTCHKMLAHNKSVNKFVTGISAKDATLKRRFCVARFFITERRSITLTSTC